MTSGQRANSFAARIVAWQRTHGRHDLPWQNTRDAYRIWLSEIMLQQTQVTTVLPYYERFLQRFPDVLSLAAASEDDVLALWAGLGYYSRARTCIGCATGSDAARRALSRPTLTRSPRCRVSAAVPPQPSRPLLTM
jgi:A/G-specific adenine glycosylase